jgi:dienelactone hydrolase
MAMFPFISSLQRVLVATVFLVNIGNAQTPEPLPRPAPTPRLDSNGPAKAGRANLTRHLDTIAAGYLATRATDVAAIHTQAEAEGRQVNVRKQILSLLGDLPERTPLNARTLGTTQTDGFHIEKVLFESQPGFEVTALLYVPDGKHTGQRLPAILMAPGHAASGKAGDYTAAATFARNGFIVLSYDPIGQGERLQYPDPARPGASLATRPTGEHGEAGLQPTLIGDTVDRYFLWDAIRAIDYLVQRPEVDPKHIGAFGCSGGGAMTALVGALDTRIAAIGVACYTTSFDALLPSIGPQDGEQSIPHFIASGLDFPDWIELAAPRPYAVIATYSDMFPFAGARATVVEARRFYSLFDPASAGTPLASAALSSPPLPTAPALNPDTTNTIPAGAALQFITGPGGHGALTPIMGNILSFFIRNLQPGTDADHPILPPPHQPGANLSTDLPRNALQVTPTGQVATSYPHSETVFTLNQKRAAEVTSPNHPALSGEQLAAAIRETTGSATKPYALKPDADTLAAKTGHFVLPSKAGIDLQGDLFIPTTAGHHPAVILLVPDSIQSDNPIARANKARFDSLAAAGNVVLAITPRPSPPGTDEMKSPILGPFYLLSLRAELASRTIVGMRLDDVIRTTDYLAARPDVDPAMITAMASGHMGLVLLHAAVVDSRLKHITIDHVLTSYRSLLDAPLPTGAPEDVIPGVLLHYDIPDLAKSLGSRLTETDPLQGTDDLSETSTPLKALSAPTP